MIYARPAGVQMVAYVHEHACIQLCSLGQDDVQSVLHLAFCHAESACIDAPHQPTPPLLFPPVLGSSAFRVILICRHVRASTSPTAMTHPMTHPMMHPTLRHLAVRAGDPTSAALMTHCWMDLMRRRTHSTCKLLTRYGLAPHLSKLYFMQSHALARMQFLWQALISADVANPF